MVWGGGGGRAPKAPKVVDFRVFSPELPHLMRISWNYSKFHVLHIFTFSWKGAQVDAWNVWKGIAFTMFLSRRGGEARNRKEREISSFLQKRMILWNLHECHEISWKFKKFTDFHPPEQPAALLWPQKPIVFLRGTKVLGRAGARGGAGAERGGNDGNLVILIKSLGIFMKATKNWWWLCVFH